MTEHADIPRPIVRRTRWFVWLVWIVPIAAIIAVALYAKHFIEQRGRLIDLDVENAADLRIGQTPVTHLGVRIGKIEDILLSPDKKQAIVRVRLEQGQDDFARQGAEFWEVRSELSTAAIKGLDTLISGPYIEGNPGAGPFQAALATRSRAPEPPNGGLHLYLRANHLDRIQPDSPVNYKGIQVGLVQSVGLGPDATQVIISAWIYPRYVPLVRVDSQFWLEPGADLQAGLFSGVQFKVDSLRALIAGAVSFATPENSGKPVDDGAIFVLHPQGEDSWKTWSPRIELGR